MTITTSRTSKRRTAFFIGLLIFKQSDPSRENIACSAYQWPAKSNLLRFEPLHGVDHHKAIGADIGDFDVAGVAFGETEGADGLK